MNDERAYYSPTEAAAALGITRRAVTARLVAGVMAGQRVGAGTWIISRAEVERWQTAGKRKPGPKPRQRSRLTATVGDPSLLA